MRHSFFISAVVLFFCSCTGNSKSELAVFKATVNALDQSNKTINDVTNNIHKQLYGRLHDPQTANRAAVWQPIASRITELSSSVINYLSKVRSQLIGKIDKDTSKFFVFKSENKDAVSKLFIEEGKGKQLYNRLKDFTNSMHNVDPEINIYYDELIKSNDDYLVYNIPDEKEFTETFFNNVSAAAAISLLAKFENDIRNTENKFVVFCFDKSTVIFCGYTVFKAIVGQSSNCVKAGDAIDITAGIGAFSTSAGPTFTVDNKKITANEEGVMVYKFRTQSKAGTYAKAVTIEYTKPDGTKSVHTYNIEYTVIDPNQK